MIKLEDNNISAQDVVDYVRSKCDIKSVLSVTLSCEEVQQYNFYVELFSFFKPETDKLIELLDFLPPDILEISQICDKLILNVDTSHIDLDDFFSAVALLSENTYILKIITDVNEVAEIKSLLDKYAIRNIYVEDPVVMEQFIKLGFKPVG